MNRKQFIILFVLVAVIGGAGLFLYNKNGDTYQGNTRVGQKLLGEFRPNDVAQITIKQSGKSLNLVRGNDGWTVQERDGYPANFDQISEFVRKAQDLKVVQTLPVSSSQLAKLDLADPSKAANSGTVVEFKGADDKTLKTMQLGKTHTRKSEDDSGMGMGGPSADGRYIAIEKANMVAVVSDPLTQAEPDAKQWLNKNFFKVEKVSSISIVAPEATNSWTLWRKDENDSWKLTEPKAGEDLDTNKVSGIANSLSHPSFTDIAVDKKPEETGLDKPTTVTVDTLDKLTYVLKVGNATPDDNHYLTVSISSDLPKERPTAKDERSEDKEKLDKEFKEKSVKLEETLKQEKAYEKWVYLVPKFSLEALLRSRAELMVEKKQEKKDEPAAKEGPPPVPSLP